MRWSSEDAAGSKISCPIGSVGCSVLVAEALVGQSRGLPLILSLPCQGVTGLTPSRAEIFLAFCVCARGMKLPCAPIADRFWRRCLGYSSFNFPQPADAAHGMVHPYGYT